MSLPRRWREILLQFLTRALMPLTVGGGRPVS